MSKPNLTYLRLEDDDKRVASMRAIQLRLTLTEYITRLVRRDAEQAGLLDLVVESAQSDGQKGGVR